jgi:hypothetical protein
MGHGQQAAAGVSEWSRAASCHGIGMEENVLRLNKEIYPKYRNPAGIPDLKRIETTSCDSPATGFSFPHLNSLNKVLLHTYWKIILFFFLNRNRQITKQTHLIYLYLPLSSSYPEPDNVRQDYPAIFEQ